MNQQKLAVQSGYWPLYRYNPDRINQGLNALQIDSKEPDLSVFDDYINNENRYKILQRTKPDISEKLIKEAKEDIKLKWKIYKALQDSENET